MKPRPSDLDLPAYAAFLPAPLLGALDRVAEDAPGVPGLRVAPGLQAEFPRFENPSVLALIVEVYRVVLPVLRGVLERRVTDRAFVDGRTRALVQDNAGRSVHDPTYATVVGEFDAAGRLVVGPLFPLERRRPVDVPPFLRGTQVTLFGPPDGARLAINAMNAVHRRRPEEPGIIEELLAAGGQVPRWGADSEDSKTPRRRDLLEASENLAACFDGTLSVTDARTQKVYALAPTGRSIPVKRVVGLAIPDGHHLLDGSPLPLHLTELVQHIWLHRHRPEALAFYIPKLENEEEAAYIATLLRTIEAAILMRDTAYRAGAIRILVVFENPRAIFRIAEMAEALHPFFVGGSLGWHDYLAATARLFRYDPGYRIPVKADPDIVINHIRESHRIMVRDLGRIGALKIGGMYGILPTDGDAASQTVSMVGFIRDVVTQMKRGLDGFWVAHPDFVRVGIALVEAWRAGHDTLDQLVSALVPGQDELTRLRTFIAGPDASGLAESDPKYLRAVLAAELGGSDRIANHDPEEVRYNVFQALQYLADWLVGNGCVALPATLRTAQGDKVFVRIMDDLATTERSRWELWAEVHHGRVSRQMFERILDEEVSFIRNNLADSTRRTQVRWEGEAARWYPIGVQILRQLVLDANPPEFVTELLLPFTFDVVRDATDPWRMANDLCPEHFRAV